jgi:hypothetical protein
MGTVEQARPRVTEPRGHHFVAQLYQHGFARERRPGEWQEVVLNRRTGEEYSANVRDIFKQRDWYAILDDEGNRDHVVENLLADLVDAPAAPAIEALREGRIPVEFSQRADIARFMAAQLTRGRSPRAAFSKFISDTQSQMLSLAAEHYSDEKWREILGEDLRPEMRERLIKNKEHLEIKPTNAMLLRALLSPINEVGDTRNAHLDPPRRTG